MTRPLDRHPSNWTPCELIAEVARLDTVPASLGLSREADTLVHGARPARTEGQ
jgi:hypothetical protein